MVELMIYYTVTNYLSVIIRHKLYQILSYSLHESFPSDFVFLNFVKYFRKICLKICQFLVPSSLAKPPPSSVINRHHLETPPPPPQWWRHMWTTPKEGWNLENSILLLNVEWSVIWLFDFMFRGSLNKPEHRFVV